MSKIHVPQPLDRRRLLKGAGAAGLALGAPMARSMPTSAQSDKLVFLTYAVYSDPVLVDGFTEQTGVSIVPENYGELDEMVTKLRARGSSGYDVVSVASNLTRQLFEEGLLLPIDTSRLSNWPDLDPAFGTAAYVQTGVEGQANGVPTVWGPEGLIYRTDLVEEPVDSWSILWNENYKGQISAIDYGYEMILIAALYLGYQDELRADPIVFTDEQFDNIKNALIEQKQLVNRYWSDVSEAVSGLASGETVATIGRILFQTELENEGIPVQLVSPKEGAQGWCTSTCIAANSENVDAAYEFLDYVISPDYGLPLAESMGYPSSSQVVLSMLPEEVRARMTFNDPNIVESMIWWQAVGDEQRWNDLWNEVRAS
ncbi:MAG: extracellular solute-binding protein [Thermomicrobiales bacterium]|jgi:spermidine/putrescine transport system substrate-binding protein|nr:extracellular solute-binding protein [Thermomicrobiales bacterium]